MTSERRIASHWFLAVVILWVVGAQANEALASIGLALCWLLAWIDDGTRAALIAERRRWIALAVFVLWALIAPLLGGDLPTGTGLARLADWIALPAATVALARLDETQQRRWMRVGAAVLLLSCLAAGLQWAGAWPPPATLQPLGLSFPRVYEEAPGGHFMGGGLLFHRLKFAHVTGLAVLMALAEAWHRRGKGRVWASIVCALGFFSVAVFPFARGAVVALIASMGWVVVGTARRRVWALGAAIVAGLLAVSLLALSPTLRSRFEDAWGKDSEDRGRLWATAESAIRQHPWVGVGLGRFHPADFAPPGVTVHDAGHTVKAHNQFLTFAAELGIPGMLLFWVMLAWWVWGTDWRTASGAAGLGGGAFFAGLSMLHDPLFHAPFSMALVLLLAHAAAGPRPRALELTSS